MRQNGIGWCVFSNKLDKAETAVVVDVNKTHVLCVFILETVFMLYRMAVRIQDYSCWYFPNSSNACRDKRQQDKGFGGAKVSEARLKG